jgi:hypothetical protein
LSALPSVEEIAELAKLATTEEQDELARLLELHVSLESPLSLALRVTGGTQPFAHTALIDRYLTALVDHALYHRSSRAATLNPALPHGIDVPAVFVRDPVADDGSGWFEHPETKEQPIYNLALSCPPQHGKSFMVSHHLLAWYLLKYPTRQAAVVSYEETFATTWAYKVRQLIEAHPEYGVYLDPSTRAKGEWILKDHGGGLMAAGVGGTRPRPGSG